VRNCFAISNYRLDEWGRMHHRSSRSGGNNSAGVSPLSWPQKALNSNNQLTARVNASFLH